MAGELEEKTQLNTSVLKQLTSVDSIAVERKYVTPYVIRPSHTLILHTNHKPEIKALDNGTWRRIILLPFHAQITNESDIKNYGEAILSWLIEGARHVYERNFQLDIPATVQEAIDDYKEDNNWIAQFLNEYCEPDTNLEGFMVQTKDIYVAYCQFCLNSNIIPHSKKDVYAAIEAQGFRRFKKNNTFYFGGLRIKTTINTLF